MELIKIRSIGKEKGQLKSLYKCSCGNTVIRGESYIISKGITSCGCDKKKRHGLSTTKTFKAWASMMDRCYKKNTLGYKNWGGRGIVVCERWKDFDNFHIDMGEIPPGLSLDRIDVNGNYEPKNVRLATSKEQNNNRRNNRIIEYNGVRKTLSQWSEQYDINPIKAAIRMDRLGWSFEKSMNIN